MEKKQAIKLSRQLKRTFCETTLNALGKRVGFCRRERELTPYRLCLGLVEAMGVSQVVRIADIQRSYNALRAGNVQYKPLHNQLAKPQFPTFMRHVCTHLLQQLTVKALHFSPGSAFARFKRIELQDGTSFALKPSLSEYYPGRFTRYSPAAVELHVSLDLLTEQPREITLTPDVHSEAQYLPAPESLNNCLVMGDRGYFKKDYLRDVAHHGGSFIIKGKANMSPTIIAAWTDDGVSRKRWENKSLKAIRAKLLKSKPMDMDVQWPDKAGVISCRMIVSWNPQTKAYQYLLTNLPRNEFSVQQVTDAYRLRWQIELLFKEWKSYANLHAFGTSNPAIAEGLIWASLCAAIMKRYCAIMAQTLSSSPLSTRKAAMCLRHVLPAIFRALLNHSRTLTQRAQQALKYLENNAKRAHPKRDVLTGRAKLGLAPVLGAA